MGLRSAPIATGDPPWANGEKKRTASARPGRAGSNVIYAATPRSGASMPSDRSGSMLHCFNPSRISSSVTLVGDVVGQLRRGRTRLDRTRLDPRDAPESESERRTFKNPCNARPPGAAQRPPGARRGGLRAAYGWLRDIPDAEFHFLENRLAFNLGRSAGVRRTEAGRRHPENAGRSKRADETRRWLENGGDAMDPA
jgi:hypothetical protein